MTAVVETPAWGDGRATTSAGPDFYALCQNAPHDAASALLISVLGFESRTIEPAVRPERYAAVRVASALADLDVRRRDDETLGRLFKSFVGVASRWARETGSEEVLIDAIPLVRRLAELEAAIPSGVLRPAGDEGTALDTVTRERRLIADLLTRRCGDVVIATYENYDEDCYLQANPDVRDALGDGTFEVGFDHFRLFGHREGRTMRLFESGRS